MRAISTCRRDILTLTLVFIFDAVLPFCSTSCDRLAATDRPFGGDVKSGKIEKIDVKTGGHVSSTNTTAFVRLHWLR